MREKRELFLKEYLSAPLSDQEREQIEQNTDQLFNSGAFDGTPSFGTGGMREIAGPGSNRLNLYNIARLNLALASALKKNNSGPVSVIIAYDSRLTSPEFSRLSYHLLKQAGFEVKIFRQPTPTPVLSFAVRYFKASAGIVITASHNPPAYNGYKVYGADGAQIIHPVDQEIEKIFNQTAFGQIPAAIHAYSTQDPASQDQIEEEVIAAYLAALKKEAFVSAGEKKKPVLYSPLHGTGGWVFERIFRELKFSNFSVLASQKNFDGNFSTVKSPNPEEISAFELLFAEGKKHKTPLLLASDPDADRVGCAVYAGDDYVFLTGNQIGALLLESIARRKAATLAKPYICKTIVTTEFQKHIAASYGIETRETLTGFKYIAAELANDPDNYLFGGEESFGYLPVNWVRDKDSISAAVALAELAESADLLQTLDQLYLKHGLYHEILHNIKLSAENTGLMTEILQKIKQPWSLAPEKIGGRKIVDILDLQPGAPEAKTAEVRHYQNKLDKGTVVQYRFEPEGRLSIRPSGTEPKIKVYVSLRYNQPLTAGNLAEAKKELAAEAKLVLNEFITLLGIPQ